MTGIFSDARCRLFVFMLAAWAVSAPSLSVAAEAEVRRPNILWLISEDTGPQLGCYGTTQVWTPNLDRMASQGVRYTHFYVGMVCSASRSSFNTGMYAVSIGAQNHRTTNKQPLPEGVHVISVLMHQAGYLSANIQRTPSDWGFRSKGKTDWNFIEKNAFDTTNWNVLKARQPFFAMLNFHETHRPFEAPKRADPAKVEIPPYYPDHPVTRADWAQYLDSVSELDRKIGIVLQQLEKDGLADNTIMVYFGDNGVAMVRGKQFCYEEGFNVPLIIRWPKNFPAPGQIKPGSVDARLLDGIDLAPTMLAIAGAPKPPKMQGRIFLGDRAESPREYVFGSRDRCDETVMRIRSVRDARYRYIRNFSPEVPFLAPNNYKEKQYPVWNLLKELHEEGKLTPAQDFMCQPKMPLEELYDLQNDPHEIRNLAAITEHQATLERLRGVLEKWIKDVNDQGRNLDSDGVRNKKGKMKK